MGGQEILVQWGGLLGNIFTGLVTELVIVILGVLFAHTIQIKWKEWRHGGWRVRVMRNDEEMILERAISPAKAKEILQEPANLSVFLKGVVSPYAIIRCDLIGEGRERGLLVEDKQGKLLIINLARNPTGNSTGKEAGKRRL